MLTIDERILKFLETQRLGVLSNISASGFPQVSVLHFSHKVGPLLSFYFSTDSTSRKVKNLASGNQAGLVIGISEDKWLTIQMDGVLEQVDEEDKTAVQAIHYAKFPGSAKFKDEPTSVFLKFTPEYLKFTDMGTDPETVLEINFEAPPEPMQPLI